MNNTFRKLESKFYSAEDISNMLDVSLTYSYRLIKKLNKELEEKGKITVRGKVSKRYFDDKSFI